jgi:glycosyltransferase involved in cell wall biosynthesis
VTAGGASPSGLRNLEGHTAYDVTWPWAREEPLRAGATAVVRVKDEARSLPFVLPPLLRAVDEVVLVDNGSTDGTPQVAAATAERAGLAHRLRQRSYPFAVARAGREHVAVHEHSVHSLAYFYNWCFSQVRTRYSWKWDGDMVLTDEAVTSMAALSWQVGSVPVVTRVSRHGLYVRDESTAYLDKGLRNAEEWGFPVGPDFVFTKGFEWEVQTTPERVRRIGLPHGLCVELKWLEGDEFAHWTDPGSFATSSRNRRKRREWEVFTALRADLPGPGARADLPTGVVEVVAPSGVHVVDFVRETWLPAQPRPFLG